MPRRGESHAVCSSSGIPHLEELEEAHYERPSVNQIEVCAIEYHTIQRYTHSNLVKLHPFCQQKEIVSYCQERGIAIQAYCPLVRGENFDHPVIQAIVKKVCNSRRLR